MNRPEPGDESDILRAINRLHRAGWSIGDAAFSTNAGIVWLVAGHNGENLIRAEGPMKSGAWRNAVDQARSLGMLGR